MKARVCSFDADRLFAGVLVADDFAVTEVEGLSFDGDFPRGATGFFEPRVSGSEYSTLLPSVR